MELAFEKTKIETKEERKHVKGLEQKVEVAYENIPKNAQMVELTATKNID
jgi:hypothetical protein